MTTKRMKEAAKVALDIASALIKNPGATTAVEESIAKGISRSTVTQARVVLEFGTAAELSQGINAEVGLRTLADTIKKRMTPEQLKSMRSRNSAQSERYRSKVRANADLWGTFGPALLTISRLPDVNDVISIVRSNATRIKAVNANVDAAAKWMEEFSNAWAAFKSASDSPNAGNGNGDVGTEHPKSAA
jgi:hypothetical protein